MKIILDTGWVFWEAGVSRTGCPKDTWVQKRMAHTEARPQYIAEKELKKWLITGSPLPATLFFFLSEGQNSYCTMQIITNWSDEPSQIKTKRSISVEALKPTAFCLLLGLFALIIVNYTVDRFKK